LLDPVEIHDVPDPRRAACAEEPHAQGARDQADPPESVAWKRRALPPHPPENLRVYIPGTSDENLDPV